MPIQATSCFEIVCDNVDTVARCDGGWDEGSPHFHDRAEAIRYATQAEFRITDTSVLCGPCARAGDCEASGHRWDDWEDAESYGVAYQRRWCRHCGKSEMSREYDQAILMGQVSVVLNNESARVARDG